MRASPMSRRRFLASFSRQRREQLAQRARASRAGSASQSGSRCEDARDHVRDGLARERLAAGEALEEHAAERPDVGAPVDRLAARLLGAHVGRGAEDHARAGARRAVSVGEADEVGLRVEPAPAPPLASPKSSTLTAPAGREHHVAGLEVAVDDPRLVRGLERGGDLAARPRAPRRAAAARARAARRASRPRRTRAPGSGAPSASSRP